MRRARPPTGGLWRRPGGSVATPREPRSPRTPRTSSVASGMPDAGSGSGATRRCARSPSRSTEVDDILRAQVARMRRSLEDAAGAGLAATQVGLLRRLFVFRLDPGPGGRRPREPADRRAVRRTRDVPRGLPELPRGRRRRRATGGRALVGEDLEGRARELEVEGFAASLLQHEIDHLDGVLTLDRATPEERGARSGAARAGRLTLSRRELLRVAGLAGVSLALPAVESSGRLPKTQVRALRAAVRGPVHTPGKHGYNASRLSSTRATTTSGRPRSSASPTPPTCRPSCGGRTATTSRSSPAPAGTPTTAHRPAQGGRGRRPRARSNRVALNGGAPHGPGARQHRFLRGARRPRRHDPGRALPDGRDRRPRPGRRHGPRRARARPDVDRVRSTTSSPPTARGVASQGDDAVLGVRGGGGNFGDRHAAPT